MKAPKETAVQKKARIARNAARNEKRALRKAEERMIIAAAEDIEPEEGVAFEKLIIKEAARQNDHKLVHSTASAIGAVLAPKTIRAARENLSEAFDFLGGVAALVVWGRQNRTEFYRLWARLIPKEAMEETAKAPLEELLRQLAERENLPVAQAALEIGAAALEEGRAAAQAEDAAALPATKYEVN